MPAPSASRALAGALVLATLLARAPVWAAPLTPDAESQLLAALGDRSGPMKVRLQAALLLGHGGTPAAVPGLLDALGDPEFPVRAAAALALGSVGDARAAAPLALRLDDPEPFVRDESAQALVQLLRRRAAPTLITHFAALEQPVKVHLLAVLAQVEPSVAEPVAASALGDPDPAVAEALRGLLASWTPPEVQRFLLAQLQSPQPAVRAGGAETVGRRRVSLAVPRLEEMLVAPEETPETVSAARHALRALAEQLDLAQLHEVVRSGHGDARLKAMATLAAIRDPAAFDLLQPMLSDPELAVRAAAAVDLGVLGDARASQALAVSAGRPENAAIQLTLQSAMRAVEQGGER